jgi:hypothetical protein
VEAVGQLNLVGNIVPHTWYTHPAFRDKTADGQGKTSLHAIILMADILYWYRPTIVRDQNSSAIVEVRQKFEADRMHKNYAEWGAQFGLTRDQVARALKLLHDNGLIVREVRTAELNGRTLGGLVFIEPVVERVRETLEYRPDVARTHTPRTHSIRDEYEARAPVAGAITFRELWGRWRGRLMPDGTYEKGKEDAAYKAFRRIDPREHGRLLEAVEIYERVRDPRFVKDLSGFLNGIWRQVLTWNMDKISEGKQEYERLEGKTVQRYRGRKGASSGDFVSQFIEAEEPQPDPDPFDRAHGQS